MIVIVRVYADGSSYADKSPYKFMTVGVIKRQCIFIYGMHSSKIDWLDFKAIDKALYQIGVRAARWSHNGVGHTYTLRG